MSFQKMLEGLGVNIYDIPHIEDIDRLALAYNSASDYDDYCSSSLIDQTDKMCSYICYLSQLCIRIANRLHNVTIEKEELEKHITI